VIECPAYQLVVLLLSYHTLIDSFQRSSIAMSKSSNSNSSQPMHPEEEGDVDTTQQRRSTASSPAKPPPTKTSSHTPLSDTPSSAKAAQPEAEAIQPEAETTQPEAEAKKSDKHYKYLPHSPVPADPIIGDVNEANELGNRLGTRKVTRSLNEAELGKVAHPVKAKGGVNPGKKSNAETNAKAKANAPEKKTAKPRGRPRNLTEPDPDTSTEDVSGITATTIHGDIVKLVKQSLQVAENVAEFMRDADEAEGNQMDVEVEKSVNDRAKKRKAKAKLAEGSVAKKAKVR
jgi:hypothetical protein